MSNLDRILEQAVKYHKSNNYIRAEKSYLQVLSQQPDNQRALNNLGNLYSVLGRYDQSFELLQRSLKLSPYSQTSLHLMANLMLLQCKYEESLSYILKAIKIKPKSAELYLTLSNIYWMYGASEKSLAAIQQSIQLNPQLANAYTTLGVIYQAQSNIDKAIQSTLKCLSIEPSNAQALSNLSCLYFLNGNYYLGWKYLEIWETSSLANKPVNFTMDQKWKGDIITSDQNILVISGKGLGDTIQFIRYALILKKLDLNFTLCIQPSLKSIIKSLDDQLDIITNIDSYNQNGSKWITLRTLPSKLGVTYNNAIINKPYLYSSYSLIQKWEKKLTKYSKPLIAINWQGSKRNESNCLRGRSLPLEEFKPISDLSKYFLISIQKGYGSEQLYHCTFKNSFISEQQEINSIWDFEEIAAIISNCSLVITTDTVTAHLAGSLGISTWLLLQKVPDWRWGLKGESSFWYPSIRLFRQEDIGEWTPVLSNVAKALNDFAPSSFSSN